MTWASVGTQRTKAELLGLVRGVLADGAIVLDEAKYLLKWIEANHDKCGQWPAKVLLGRLETMVSDDVLDIDEQRELLSLLCEYIAAQDAAADADLEPIRISTEVVTVHSPYDVPAPDVEYVGRCFVVTGDFACGKRSDVVAAIESRGGRLASSVSKKVNFLIVGHLGSRDWIGGSYGTKIDAAIELRRVGTPLAIISEETWYASTVRQAAN